MKLFGPIVVLAVSALVNLGAAQAAEREHPRACRADVQKLCKGVQPGEGRVAMCLKEHEQELSSGCRDQIARARERGREWAEACKPDAEKFCKGVQAGQGRVASCLQEHEAELSGACRDKMAQAKRRHPCMADMQRLCKDVPAGEGRKMQCMKQHEAELSAECKAHHKHEGGKARE